MYNYCDANSLQYVNLRYKQTEVLRRLATTNLFRVFGDIFFAHPSPDILTKHNIRETDTERNIWGPFYISYGEGEGGG